MQKPVRFILIDDEMYSNVVSRTFIRKMYPNIELVEFLSPVEALHYISHSFAAQPVSAAVLLDINMPGLDGWEVLEQLKTLPSPVLECLSVYMLSSSIDPKDKQKAAAHPLIKGYIEKPLSRALLKDVFGE